MSNTITSEAELDEIYGQPVAVTITKEIDHISAHYRAFTKKFTICGDRLVRPGRARLYASRRSCRFRTRA